MKDALIFLGIFFIVIGVVKAVWGLVLRRTQKGDKSNG